MYFWPYVSKAKCGWEMVYFSNICIQTAPKMWAKYQLSNTIRLWYHRVNMISSEVTAFPVWLFQFWFVVNEKVRYFDYFGE